MHITAWHIYGCVAYCHNKTLERVKMLGIISGTPLLKECEVFRNVKEVCKGTEYGKVKLMITDDIAFIARHGYGPNNHILPHIINHQANMKAFQEIGVKEIIGVNSTGSLKIALQPGSVVIPDDFIMLASYPSVFVNQAIHLAAGLDREVRVKVLRAAKAVGIDAKDGGTYWQTTGPRLETCAEIRMMSQFADLVGMTMASEAILAQELGLRYASVCSVDNYAHGLVGKNELSMDQISAMARIGGATISRLIIHYVAAM